MNYKVVVCGVGIVPFRKTSESNSYELMGKRTTIAALKGAGLAYSNIDARVSVDFCHYYQALFLHP